jgi:hypothetical protein
MGSRPRIRIRPEAPRPRPRPTGLTLLDAINDPNLFAPWFKDPRTWNAWLAFIASLFGLPLSKDQLAIYGECTGRNEAPTEPATEGWLICGRRAGKSFVLALIAVFLACFREYREFLAPGERATVFVVATDRKQARIIVRYIRALLSQVLMLARLIEREWAEGFDLSNRVTIEVATASFRSVRGYTLAAVLLDELAFWPTDDTANPDFEVIAAIRPGMATVPGALLLAASSPYARRGALWDAYRRHFGKDGSPVLVWQAETSRMNPSIDPQIIADAYEADPANAAAEFGAKFRADIESLLNREAIEACISVGIHERAPISSLRYSAFVDPSGGSADSFTLAIAHREKEVGVLDCIREIKPPFSPEAVVSEFAELLKSYGINTVLGDRYGGDFPRELFRKHRITYEPAAKPKSDIYRELLPVINSRTVDLLDHPKLMTQLVGLERRTARSGKDSIDHSPGAHDDVANAVAGVLTNLTTKKYRYDSSMAWIGSNDELDQFWRAGRLHRFINSGGIFR